MCICGNSFFFTILSGNPKKNSQTKETTRQTTKGKHPTKYPIVPKRQKAKNNIIPNEKKRQFLTSMKAQPQKSLKWSITGGVMNHERHPKSSIMKNGRDFFGDELGLDMMMAASQGHHIYKWDMWTKQTFYSKKGRVNCHSVSFFFLIGGVFPIRNCRQ